MSNPDSAARTRFLALLREDILQVDAADLDFGIYRVLNHRRAEIERFLSEGLPARIASALAALDGEASEDEQARIYNALYTFFARYYDDGDFMPRARRGRGAGAYCVPYDGSDTFFHWATKGSHYVKSGERFTGYAYRQSDGARVRLTVAAADVERDNAKGAQRYYVPAGVAAPGDDPAGASGAEWRIAFDHRPLSEDEARRHGAARRGAAKPGGLGDAPEAAPAQSEGRDVQERLLNAWLAEAALPRALDRAALERHARRYVRGRSADFFVHPQLGAFLRGELDHYLKSEFLNLWDLPAAALGRERGKLALCRDIGHAIVDVLAALEDVQARLFEKRKFVLEASYLVQCSWLAAQGQAGAALVARAAAHAPQVARWRQWLGGADELADGSALLARYPHLPLDTALFDDDFRWAVLACAPDLTEATGGVLVHGDNYAALRTLEPLYRSAVKCIYIDPPYNTGGDGFLYKDDFMRHSTWASLIEERLRASLPMLSETGVLFSSIDHNERATLGHVLDETFGAENKIGEIVWHNVTDNNPTNIANEHEFIQCSARDAQGLPPAWKSSLSGAKELLLEVGRELIASHTDPQDLQRQYSAWFRDNKEFLGPLDRYKFIDAGGVYTGSQSVHNPGKEGYRYDVLHKTTGRPCKQPLMGYRFPEETMRDLLTHEKILFGETEEKIVELKVYAHEYEAKLSSVLTLDGRAGANELRSLFAGSSSFKNPKPCGLLGQILPFATDDHDLILDYFAGSGTTGHAVINLNREDGGRRRFVLVEQGEYFDSVTLPRIAKAMTSPEWKDGRPKDVVAHDPGAADAADAHWSRRTLPVVQVLRLERYEDSLDALALPEQAQASAAGQAELAGLDTLLRYLADTTRPDNPVRLATERLAQPFDYRLPTVWEGRHVERTVDLLHTALALLGLHLVRVRRLLRTASAAAPLPLAGASAGDRAAVVLAEVRPHRPGLPPASVPLELLVLRDFDLDGLSAAAQRAAATAEYRWLADAVPQAFGKRLADYAVVRHNRDLLLPGAGERGESIDAALARAMWVRDSAFSGASPAPAVA